MKTYSLYLNGAWVPSEPAWNVVSPGDPVLVVKTGYFSDRMDEMLRRARAEVSGVGSEPGDAPSIGAIEAALSRARERGRPIRALFATHVDTSTGVRVDPEPVARLARVHGALSVFDGVCATAGERFDMAGWDADVYLTASQKAIGLPPGLGLMVAGPRALAARARRHGAPPPLVLDWLSWQPILKAYEASRLPTVRQPSLSI